VTDIRTRQWYDENSDRKFPFEDHATMMGTAGDTISNSLFLDALLHPAGHAGELYISRITLAADLITIVIGDSAVDEICYCEFDPVTVGSSLKLVDFQGRPAGVLVSDAIRLSELLGWEVGDHLFDRSATSFVAAVVVPVPEQGVSGLRLENGDIATGDFWLIGDDGVVLSTRVVDSVDAEGEPITYNVIRADAVGDPLFRRKLCAPGRFTTPRFLRSLNIQSGNRSMTVLPNSRGDLQITVGSDRTHDTILRIKMLEAGMEVSVVGEQLKR